MVTGHTGNVFWSIALNTLRRTAKIPAVFVKRKQCQQRLRTSVSALLCIFMPSDASVVEFMPKRCIIMLATTCSGMHARLMAWTGAASDAFFLSW